MRCLQYLYKHCYGKEVYDILAALWGNNLGSSTISGIVASLGISLETKSTIFTAKMRVRAMSGLG